VIVPGGCYLEEDIDVEKLIPLSENNEAIYNASHYEQLGILQTSLNSSAIRSHSSEVGTAIYRLVKIMLTLKL
jgi:predicted mannosyl-3-phosphoglycerate phosphatase (HAD superfamily)